MANLQTVQAIYQAFGQGDIPSILEKLTEDVNWDVHSPIPEVPWMAPRKGRAEVPLFFQSLAEAQFKVFHPHTFFENERQVLALVDLEVIFPTSPKTYQVRNEVHLWTFNDAGLVTDFEHIVDTLLHVQAHRGE